MSDHVLSLLQNPSVTSSLRVKAKVFTGDYKALYNQIPLSSLASSPKFSPSPRSLGFSLVTSLNFLKILNMFLPQGLYTCLFLCLVCSTSAWLACFFFFLRSLSNYHSNKAAFPEHSILNGLPPSIQYFRSLPLS